MKTLKVLLSFVLSISMFSLPITTKADTNENSSQINNRMSLWYDESANIYTAETNGGEWMQQSLPLGNGDLGNLIFGGVSKERIHVNQKTLWTGGPAASRPNYNFGNKTSAYTNAEIQEYRELLDDKSTNVFNDLSSLGGVGMGAQIRFPGENNLNKGSYQDFADVYLDYSKMGVTDENVENYYRGLNLQTGIASTVFEYKDTIFSREHFVSYPDKVMVTKLSAQGKEKLNINVLFELNNANLSGTYVVDEENQTISIYGDVKDNGLKYYSVLKVCLKDGQITKNNQSFNIVDASEVVLILSAETNYINDFPTYRDQSINLEETCENLVNSASNKSYDQLKENHLADHQQLFDRVAFDLYEDLSDVPTDELVKAYRNGEYSHYLEVLSFQFGRYLTIAGSRGELPSNLVGLWTVGDSAWTGDYHFNVNVQMNYWPVYVTNLAECGETMVQYMENLREPGRVTAQYVHGIENAMENQSGFTVHTENNPFGMCAPTNSQEYGWNPTGAAWAIQNIWAHYEFTQDEKYLKEVIYPIMKEAALFWDQYLWESKYQVINDESSPYNGQNRLVVAPSFSEEQGPTTIGTTYDQSLVWELYKEVIEAGKIVGESQDLITQWEETMQKLDPIEINATNGIKEWYEETRVGLNNGHNQSYAQAGNLNEIAVPNSGWNIGHPGEHRHASHLVGLYPGTLINSENETYMEAAITSLEERGEYSTGWSKANKINLWARTKNGDKAYKILNNLIGGNSSGLQLNLFDSHGSGGGETMMNGSPVWQIDGNYGLTSGVAEMLLQSHLDYVEFLPALPQDWANGKISGLKARGNFTIDQEWYNNLPTTFTVEYNGNEESTTFVGSYAQICDAKVYANDAEVSVTKDIDKQQISFEVKPNTTYTIDMRSAYEEEYKQQATQLLDTMHEDLVEVKKQLEEALTNNQDLINVYNVAKEIDVTYKMALPYQYDIYYCDEDLTTLDTMYSEMMRGFAQLKAGNLQFEEVSAIKQTLKDLIQYLKTNEKTIEINIVENKLDFKYDTNYDLRYTLDGSDVKVTSDLYESTITLNGNEIVKAALFENDQVRSKEYAKACDTTISSFTSMTSPHTNVWDGYGLDKAIDNDTTTRWASRSVNTQQDFEIIFKTNQQQAINGIMLDVFVSNNNMYNAYEIYALVDEAYQLMTSGSKLAHVDDRTSNLDGASGGYHAAKSLTFDQVVTNEIKLVLKAGFVGEPSIYEAKYISESKVVPQNGNKAALDAILKEAKEQNLDQDYLKDVNEATIEAFTYVIKEEFKEDLTQNTIDAIIGFIELHMKALGFRVTDKTLLADLINEAMSLLSNLKDERYGELLQVIADSKFVSDDETLKQPQVDQQVQLLEAAIENNQLTKAELLLNKNANHNFEVVSVTSQCGVSGSPNETGGGQITKVFDFDPNTYWHTDYTNHAYMPQEIIIDLKQSYDVHGIEFLPRQTGTNGDIFKIEVAVSDSKATFETYEAFEYANNGKTFITRDMKEAFFNEIQTGRYLKVKVVASGGDVANKYASMSELRVYANPMSDEVYIKTLEDLLTKAQTKVIDEALIEEATQVFNNTEATQKEVDEVSLRLCMAITVAEDKELPQVNKDALIKAIADAEKVDKEAYTTDSIAALEVVLASAKVVNENANATQEEVDSATKAVTDALAALATKPTNPSVDKEALKAAIEAAKKIDTTNKTDESVAVLASAITAAQSIIDKDDATQVQVDAAKEALKEAVANLKDKVAMNFVDVKKGAWFYGSVENAYQKGLMSNTGKGKEYFEPDTPISRGMVATVLYRMAGLPKVEFKATFSDVTNAKLWYSTAITWASQAGVVSGYKDGSFGPDDNITRQDLAIMLRNYAKSCGLDTNVTVDFTSFKDGNKVVSYAQSAVQFCIDAKLMSGAKKADGVYLNPSDKATRAECAKMFSLLDDAIKTK